MKDTLFIDFDGVIRHWSSDEIRQAEELARVDEGTLFSVAFAPQFLTPAIEGRINHEQWLVNVELELTKRHNESVSLTLMAGWKNASWTVDSEFLSSIKATAPNCKRVLVTNATSKLSSDLKESGVVFDSIVNSAEIGTAKPSIAFYTEALAIAKTTAEKSIFIDDDLTNVEAAISLGIDSIQHKNIEDTLAFVRQKCR